MQWYGGEKEKISKYISWLSPLPLNLGYKIVFLYLHKSVIQEHFSNLTRQKLFFIMVMIFILKISLFVLFFKIYLS